MYFHDDDEYMFTPRRIRKELKLKVRSGSKWIPMFIKKWFLELSFNMVEELSEAHIKNLTMKYSFYNNRHSDSEPDLPKNWEPGVKIEDKDNYW